MAGLFIAFEGGEGAGKTTQAGMLHDKLVEHSVPCRLFREPGGTVLGEYLRAYLKGHNPIAPEAELLLFEAARTQLVIERIYPALVDGLTVIADRFAASTISYQGHGRGIDIGTVTALNRFATHGIQPDLVILLDVAPVVGLSRSVGGLQLPFDIDWATSISPNSRKIDDRRFEDLDLSFHEKVRQGFRVQAEANSEKWVVIDAELSIEDVSGKVWKNVRDRITPVAPTSIPTPTTTNTRLSIPQAALWPLHDIDLLSEQ